MSHPTHSPLSSPKSEAKRRKSETGEALKVLFVTSNNGSCFEKPATIAPWMAQIQGLLDATGPGIAVLHFQEVGGSKAEFDHAPAVEQALRGVDAARYWSSPLLYCAAVTDEQRFNKLGVVVYIDRALLDVAHVYNFATQAFEGATAALSSSSGGGGGSGAAGSSTNDYFVSHRFSRRVNPEMKAKGWLHTRWRVGAHTPLSLFNIHMFADVDNVATAATSPSLFATQRAAAFTEMLQSAAAAASDTDGLFIFGDFNWRLDQGPLLAYARAQLGADVVERHSKSEFVLRDAEQALWRHATRLAHIRATFDVELARYLASAAAADAAVAPLAASLRDVAPVAFPPSFRRALDSYQYSTKRCPAWPDRVLCVAARTADATQRVAAYDIVRVATPAVDHLTVYASLEWK